MADNVLSSDEIAFIKANATTIKQFASETFAGHIPMEAREKYEHITLKLGRRFNICWTCGASLKRIGMQLEQYLWH